MDSPDIQQLVDGLSVPERSHSCYEELKAAGSCAVPFLAAAAKECRAPGNNLDSSATRELPDLAWPLFRIAELLAISGSQAAIVHFADCLIERDQSLREYGAWGLGSIALEGCLKPVKEILASDNRRMKTLVVGGIGRALAAGRGDSDFLAGISGSLNEFLYFEIGDTYQALIEVENRRGIAALSPHERNYWAASIYYFEIMNGGLWQYFGNSTADYHSTILSGLIAIGAPGTAQILEEAGRAFGSGEPPEDREARNSEIDRFSGEQVMRIENLNQGPIRENIELLLFLYGLSHKSEFPNYQST